MINNYSDRYEEYLKDESKLIGCAKSISFVPDIESLQNVIEHLKTENSSVTLQGSKTGICGGATPTNDHLAVLSQLNAVLDFYQQNDVYYVRVQCGLTLMALNEMLSKRNIDMTHLDEQAQATAVAFRKAQAYFWPVNPTEQSASIGGIVACNAKGIYAYHYQTNDYIEAITVLLSSNELFEIKRGQYTAKDGYIDFAGKKIKAYQNDLIDIFIGSEGQYGIIVDITIKLIPVSEHIWGLGFFFKDEKVYDFIEICKQIEDSDTCFIAALEFADYKSLQLVNDYRKQNSRLAQLPVIDDEYTSMVYLELHATSEESIESIAFDLMTNAEMCGLDEAATWALIGQLEIEKYHIMRHAIPEAVNIQIETAKQKDEQVHKLGTDIALHNTNFKEQVQKVYALAKSVNIDVAIFGHIGDAHFHANFLPKNGHEFEMAKKALTQYYADVDKKSCYFVEHGIGKIKKEYFLAFAKQEVIDSKRDLKDCFDEKHLFNIGSLL